MDKVSKEDNLYRSVKNGIEKKSDFPLMGSLLLIAVGMANLVKIVYRVYCFYTEGFVYGSFEARIEGMFHYFLGSGEEAIFGEVATIAYLMIFILVGVYTLLSRVIFKISGTELHISTGVFLFRKHKSILLNQIKELQIRNRQVLLESQREPLLTYEVVAILRDATVIPLDEGLPTQNAAEQLTNFINQHAHFSTIKLTSDLSTLPNLKEADASVLKGMVSNNLVRITNPRIYEGIGDGVFFILWGTLIILMIFSSFQIDKVNSSMMFFILFFVLSIMAGIWFAQDAARQLDVSIVGDELIIRRGFKTISVQFSNVANVRANAGKAWGESSINNWEDYGFVIEFVTPTEFGRSIDFWPSKEFRKAWNDHLSKTDAVK